MTSEVTEGWRSDAIPRYARTDVLGGAAMVFIAGLVWYGAIGLEIGGVINFGSGAMPNVLAALLAVAGTAVLVQGLVRPAETAERFDFALRPTAILVLAISLFGLFIRGGVFGPLSTPQLGLTVVGPVTVFVAGCASHKVHGKELLVLAFGLTAAVLVVFPDLLGVSIPIFPKIVQDAIPPSIGPDLAMRAATGAYAGIAAILWFVFFRLRGVPRG